MDRDRQRPSLRHRLNGVDQQVYEHLLELLGIGIDDERREPQLQVYLDALFISPPIN